MSDITMCSNKECKLSSECYRFNVKENPYRQSYLSESKKDCEADNYALHIKL